MSKKVLIPFVVALGLTGCGGGSSSSDTPATETKPVQPANRSIGGIWQGFGTNDRVGGASQFIGVGTEDGRFRFVDVTTSGQLIGTASISGSKVSASGKGFAPAGTTWLDGTVATSVTLNGTIAERSDFGGTWRAGTGETGSFSFDYDSAYERGSSLSKVADVWYAQDGYGNLVATITIQANGAIYGQDGLGCMYSGTIGIIDPAYNVYDAEIIVSGCVPRSEKYSGLAVLTDRNLTNDRLVVAADNGQKSEVRLFFR